MFDPEEWHQIRGAQMMISMKLISIVSDLDDQNEYGNPSIIEVCGYALFPGNIVFGPWISFQEYKRILKDCTKMVRSSKYFGF